MAAPDGFLGQVRTKVLDAASRDEAVDSLHSTKMAETKRALAAYLARVGVGHPQVEALSLISSVFGDSDLWNLHSEQASELANVGSGSEGVEPEIVAGNLINAGLLDLQDDRRQITEGGTPRPSARSRKRSKGLPKKSSS